MDAEQRAIDEHELLSQLGWVRALARSLVRDPEVADDVLQQVCLVALQQVPSDASRGPRLRAWLAAVTRSLVRRAARTDFRRVRREQAVASGEALPSTVDVAARREALRALVDAVASLEEPHFSSVVERYFDGRSVAEIAARHALTEAAVRQRLTRARQQLRARLTRLIDEEPGGWLRSVLPLAPASAALVREPAGLSIHQLGGLVAKPMGINGLTKALLALGIVAGLLLTGGWLLLRPVERASVPSESASALPDVEPVAPAAAAAPAPQLPAPGALLAQGEADALEYGDVVLAREPLAVSIVGRVVDEAGGPLAGATVELLRPSPDVSLALSGRPHAGLLLASTHSDDDGRFALPARLPPDMHLPQRTKFLEPTADGPDILATLPGHAPAIVGVPVERGGERQVGDLVLPRGASLTFEARDQHGLDAQDVTVTVDYEQSPAGRIGSKTREPTARALGAAGFLSDGLAAGTASVTIGAAGAAPSTGAGVELALGTTTDLGSLRLGAATTLAGTVRDARSEPVAGAWVVARPAQQFSKLSDAPKSLRAAADREYPKARLDEIVTAGADGSFQLGSLAAGRCALVVGAPGFASTIVRSTDVPGPPVDVTLLDAGRVELKFVDAETGLPLEPQQVQARQPDNSNEILTLEPSTGADGGAVYGLDSRTGNWVFVRCPGYPLQTCEIEPVEPGAHRVDTLSLVRGCLVRGRVVDSAGEPLENRGVLATSGHMQLRFFGAESSARTDPDGGFELGPLVPSEWWTLSAGGGAFAVTRQKLTIEDGQREIEVTLRLDTAGSVSGRLLDARGNPLGDRIVILNNGVAGDMGLRSLADAAGRFEFRALGPHPYTLTSESPRAEQSLELAAGQQAIVDLVVPASARISGLVTSAGEPVVSATVQLFTEIFGDLGRNRTTTTDERGAYAFEELRFGRYGVSATPVTGSESSRLELVLAPGAEAIADLDLSGGTITGLAVIRETGEALSGAFVSLQQQKPAVLSPPTGADGAFRFELVSPGSVLLEGTAKGYGNVLRRLEVGSDPAQPATVRLEFEPGATVEGDVRAADGTPATGQLTLRLTRDDEPDFARKQPIEAGRYRIEALAPGHYRAAVLGHGTPTAFSPSGKVLIETSFSLSSGQVLRQDVVLPGS
jgi:RNA polymerase sigma-70 factor (ECF subfamily)